MSGDGNAPLIFELSREDYLCVLFRKYEIISVLIPFHEKIVSKVDAMTSDRVEFMQRAVLEELKRNEGQKHSNEIDQRLIDAYTRQPQRPEEYEIWQDEQVWED